MAESKTPEITLEDLARQCQEALACVVGRAKGCDPDVSLRVDFLDVDKLIDQQRQYSNWTEDTGALLPPESELSLNHHLKGSLMGQPAKYIFLSALKGLKSDCDTCRYTRVL